MKKLKYYHPVRFPSEVLRRAEDAFIALIPEAQRGRIRRTWSATVGREGWTHDSADEFYSDYRRDPDQVFVMLKSRELVLDHLIPISLLGADELANLVAMSKEHNAAKWDRLLRDDIKFYRSERVRGRFGVRFIGGAFWPVINGKVRYSRPAA